MIREAGGSTKKVGSELNLQEDEPPGDLGEELSPSREQWGHTDVQGTKQGGLTGVAKWRGWWGGGRHESEDFQGLAGHRRTWDFPLE